MGSTTHACPLMAIGSHSTPEQTGSRRRRSSLPKCTHPGLQPSKDWIVISQDAEAPAWSPDASLLYFWSDRDGSPCLWAQRLDPTTRRPTGEPLSIQHFHSRGLSWKNLHLGAPDTAVARGKIVFNLGEHTGNIWMTQLRRAQE